MKYLIATKSIKYAIGFTLIELLLVIGMLAILAFIVIIAINPQKQLADMRNAKREADTKTIIDAVYQYSLDNKGIMPETIGENWKIISSSDGDDCNIPCGSDGVGTIDNSDETLANFNLGSYQNTIFNETSNSLELSDSGKTAGSGNYYSQIKDMGTSSVMTSLSWLSSNSPEEELPNDGEEDPYTEDPADMEENVLLLHLNETSGTTITDTSGNNNNGIIYSPANYSLGQDGRFDKAIRFMNNSQTDGGQIIIPHNETLSLGESGTVCAWINLTDTSQSWAGIVHKGVRADFTDEEYSLQLYYGNKAVFNVTDTNGIYKLAVGNTSLLPNQWYHLCGTYERGDATKIYVNGVLDNSSSWEEASIPVTNTNTTLQIGSQLVGTNKYGFKGLIDEVAIFKKTLSVEEIDPIYTRGATKIKFQVRACNNIDCSDSSFVGPDNTGITFFTKDNSSGTNPFTATTDLTGKYWQYRALFETSSDLLTPKINRVTIAGHSSYQITETSCANLSSLTPDYLVSLPIDDSLNNGLTNYAIKKTANGRINVRACNPENDKTIEQKR
jgi:type II secretory pathway pseudopilin PulG